MHFFLSFLVNCVQIGLAMVAISMLFVSGIVGYTGLCISAWSYGLALGCYRYTLKMFALERVRAKHFTKAWGKKLSLKYVVRAFQHMNYGFECRKTDSNNEIRILSQVSFVVLKQYRY